MRRSGDAKRRGARETRSLPRPSVESPERDEPDRHQRCALRGIARLYRDMRRAMGRGEVVGERLDEDLVARLCASDGRRPRRDELARVMGSRRDDA